jgi:hypothetical protein
MIVCTANCLDKLLMSLIMLQCYYTDRILSTPCTHSANYCTDLHHFSKIYVSARALLISYRSFDSMWSVNIREEFDSGSIDIRSIDCRIQVYR